MIQVDDHAASRGSEVHTSRITHESPQELEHLLSLVRERGLRPGETWMGGDVEAPLAWVLFEDIADGVEFLRHTAHGMNYLFPDQVAMTICRPPEAQYPMAKCVWHPVVTNAVLRSWESQSKGDN